MERGRGQKGGEWGGEKEEGREKRGGDVGISRTKRRVRKGGNKTVRGKKVKGRRERREEMKGIGKQWNGQSNTLNIYIEEWSSTTPFGMRHFRCAEWLIRQ